MLSPDHAAMLRESAINDEVVSERGYRSVDKTEAAAFGFKGAQQRAGLLIPIRDVHGNVALHQLRPDKPRTRKGKPIKYETPPGSRMVLDVPYRSRPLLGDPSVPLWITEGVKKADALVSAGACAIGLAGVWNWRGTNPAGGKTALSDFEEIAWNGRTVLLAFDSDCSTNAHVQQALGRLAASLIHRDARVRFVVLPQAGDDKVGVDDFLAAGHSLDAVLALAQDTLPREPGAKFVGPYMFCDRGIRRLGHDHAGNPIETPIANFTAEIVADVVEDDGAETSRSYDVEARLQGREPMRVRVPARAFESMSWVADELGARASIAPERGAKEHARAAIQMASEDVPERRVFTHSGWRTINGEPAYLHAGGALGADGPIDDVEVRLMPALRHLQLPDPPEGGALAAAVRRALLVLDVAPHPISVPIFVAPFAAVLGVRAFSVFVVGETGTFKTAVGSVVQQFLGRGFDPRHLPGSWSSTANYLEVLLHSGKDALILLDDFQSSGGFERQRLEAAADRALRGAVDGASRGRLRSDGSARPDRPPRALVMVTGEDTPKRHSLLARQVIVEIERDHVRVATLSKLQSHGREGALAAAMSGFIRWCAADLTGIRQRMRQRQVDLREEATSVGQHRRTPDAAAALGAVFEVVLKFAAAAGAIVETKRAELWDAGWAAVLGDAVDQADHLDEEHPARKFIRLVSSALATGRAHLLAVDGSMPEDDHARRWGWREHPGWRQHDLPSWQPSGAAIGWVENDGLYLDSASAVAVATRLARDGDDGLAVGRRTLHKRLAEAHFLRGTETEGNKTRFEIRKVIDGVRRRVLHLRAADVFEAGQSDGRTGQSAEVGRAVGHAESAPVNGKPENGPLGPLSEEGYVRTTGKIT